MTARTVGGERKPGTFLPNNKANPGGMTVEERASRDMVRQALASPAMRAKGLAAYERLLDADNPLIVKDFMDRAVGKVKERVELSEDPETERPLSSIPDALTEFALWRVERKRESLQNAQPAK